MYVAFTWSDKKVGLSCTTLKTNEHELDNTMHSKTELMPHYSPKLTTQKIIDYIRFAIL